MQLNRRRMILGLVGTGLGFSGAVAAQQPIIGGYAFGSSWRVTTDGGTDLSAVRSTVNSIVARIDRSMSPFRKSSELSQFNEQTTTAWQRMPQALCHVVSEALAIAELTDGAFDPTVGPLVSKYGFGPIKGRLGRYTDIAIREGAVRKASPGLTLDLCGIAKGYALDQITEALADAGVMHALVEVGGEVKALGQHPDGRGWNVAIADPNSAEFRAHSVVNPGPYALATSGHSSNGLRGPISTSHLIDPHRGRPASTILASVTVLAPTALRADALATALCAVGLDVGLALARRLNVAALFVTDRSAGPTDMTHIMTGDFSRHILI